LNSLEYWWKAFYFNKRKTTIFIKCYSL